MGRKSKNKQPKVYSSNATKPTKVRTERYLKIYLNTFMSIQGSDLIVSEVTEGNGRPKKCWVLRYRTKNLRLALKGLNTGWIAVNSTSCCEPDFTISFEAKFSMDDPQLPGCVHFDLIYKNSEQELEQVVGTYTFPLVLMSHKVPEVHLRQSLQWNSGVTIEQANSLPPLPCTPSLRKIIPKETAADDQRKLTHKNGRSEQKRKASTKTRNRSKKRKVEQPKADNDSEAEEIEEVHTDSSMDVRAQNEAISSPENPTTYVGGDIALNPFTAAIRVSGDEWMCSVPSDDPYVNSCRT